MIFNAACNDKALHIVDFGILHGFQWPVLIQHLSAMLGRPPKLRITGIDFPQPGIFRPTVGLKETVDAVLSLIRKINPDIFVQTLTNGSYSSPLFATRFQEAHLHYSALFGMLDATLSRDDQQRLHFEQEIYRCEAMNVIAYEGAERVERPEMYEQWQVRNVRGGFELLPLNQEVMQKLKDKVNAGYHRDFVLYEDGNFC
ncbi:hypothetical protein K7X08_023299 [Anisodus acutangulus]|uniref:Uncharacterized protein n=1 Tax=Anisodus acutangulus TaxID=402998 RepID=A0A9Q1LIF6_9SOLA|nr:hypothetical protein K7X08_023299 [Anisodus acutangulus]